MEQEELLTIDGENAKEICFKCGFVMGYDPDEDKCISIKMSEVLYIIDKK